MLEGTHSFAGGPASVRRIQTNCQLARGTWHLAPPVQAPRRLFPAANRQLPVLAGWGRDLAAAGFFGSGNLHLSLTWLSPGLHLAFLAAPAQLFGGFALATALAFFWSFSAAFCFFNRSLAFRDVSPMDSPPRSWKNDHPLFTPECLSRFSDTFRSKFLQSKHGRAWPDVRVARGAFCFGWFIKYNV
jgi:hypothetical protein